MNIDSSDSHIEVIEVPGSSEDGEHLKPKPAEGCLLLSSSYKYCWCGKWNSRQNAPQNFGNRSDRPSFNATPGKVAGGQNGRPLLLNSVHQEVVSGQEAWAVQILRMSLL